MSDCDKIRLIHAYHDGQLSAAQASEVEAHLASCAACAHELAWLGGLSRSMSDYANILPPATLMSALHDHIDQADWPVSKRQHEDHARRNAGVWRLSEWLTAAAAVILAVSLWLLMPGDQSSAAMTPIIPARTSVAIQTAMADVNQTSHNASDHNPLNPDEELAAWMVTNLQDQTP